MIGHQAVGVDPHAEFVDHFREGLQKSTTVLIIEEYRPPLIPPGHHVIDRPRELDANRTRHAAHPATPHPRLSRVKS